MAIADLDHPAELRRLLISRGVPADADARALIEQGWELEALTWRPASGCRRGG